MMRIDGVITTTHRNPSCIAGAIRVDNLSAMETSETATAVITTVTGTKLRSVIASVDDYLMNLSIADEACRYGDLQAKADKDRQQDRRTDGTRQKVR